MTSNFKFYHYWRSSCSWRVRWALNHKKLAYQSITIDLRQGEHQKPQYLQINPIGTVPCLDIGGKVISESLAIIEWLEEQHPKEALFPQDSWSRAKIRQFCGLVSGIQAVQNLKVLKKFSTNPAQQQLWAHYFIEQGLHTVEKILRQEAGTYCFGGHLSAADLFLIPQVYNAQRFKVNLSQFPIAEQIYQRCLSIPACDQAAPHNQPGAQP